MADPALLIDLEVGVGNAYGFLQKLIQKRRRSVQRGPRWVGLYIFLQFLRYRMNIENAKWVLYERQFLCRLLLRISGMIRMPE